MRQSFHALPALLIATAGLLVIAVGVVAVFSIREYGRQRDSADAAYTRLVKRSDRIAATSKAVDALQDAVLREQGYVLTGETVYYEAYSASSGEWQDQVSALGIQAANTSAAPLVQELAQAGDRAVKELGLVVALYDQGSADKALARLRKGAATVYLDQTRVIATKILDADQDQVGYSDQQLTIASVFPFLRLAKRAGVLCFLALIGALLLIFEARREYAVIRAGENRPALSSLSEPSGRYR
jgi:CHASE3 domain sensor protein